MRVHCCYTHRKVPPPYTTDAEHCVNKYRDAIKGDFINGNAFLPTLDKVRRELNYKNAAVAFDWFGEMAADLLKKEILDGEPIFVPFPDSKCTVAAKRASKTRRLADAVVQHYRSGVVADILRFNKEMASSHSQGGTRDAKTIFANLRTIGTIVARPYVIVDDVLTSGGHLQAGIAELQNGGARVVLGMCALRVQQSAVADPFARVVFDLPVLSFHRMP